MKDIRRTIYIICSALLLAWLFLVAFQYGIVTGAEACAGDMQTCYEILERAGRGGTS